MDPLNTLQQIDDALDSLPEEVKDFLYKGAFDQSIAALVQTYGLTQEQKQTLDYHITQAIMLLEHRDDLVKLCQGWGFDEAKQQAFMNDVEQSIIVPVVQATNYTVEGEFEGEAAQGVTVNAPSPADVLASLKARMTTPTAIAPVARELSSGPAKPTAPTVVTPAPAPAPATAQKPAAPARKPAFDIYREQV